MPFVGIGVGVGRQRFAQGGGGVLPFEFTVKTDNAGVSTSTQFQLPLVSSLPLNAVVDWGDSTTDTITTFNQAETLHTYASSGTYTIKITGDLSGWEFNNGGDRLKILNIASWGVLNISVANGFYGCGNLTATATDAPLISSTSLAQCFRSCTNFNGAIGNWDVSAVTSLSESFRDCINFNGAIGNWDVSSVTNMGGIFYTARAFNQDIGNWDVSSVTNMFRFFRGAQAFNQDIGSWDVSNVTNFGDFMSGKTAALYSAANLDSIYNGWSSLPSLSPNESITFGTAKYNASAQAGKDILTSAPNNWTIVDGGQV